MSLEVTVRLAALAFEGTAFVVLADAPDQPVRAAHGVSDETRRRYQALFGAVEPFDVPFFVEDAAAPGALQTHPWLSGVSKLQFVGGAPIRLEGAAPVGMLYVVDEAPHATEAADRAMLAKLARLAAEDVLARPEAPTRHISSKRTLIQRALNALSDLFFVFTPEGEFLRWNDRVPAATGYSDDEIASMHPADFFSAEDEPRIHQAIRRVIEEGEARVEADLMTKEGRTFPCEFTGSLLTDHAGAVIGICGVGRDISERKLAEAALHESEAWTRRLSMVASRTTNGVVITDEDGRIEWVNEGFTRICGYSLDEVRGEKPGHVLQGPESDPETVAYMRQQVEAQEGFTAELINYTKSGKPYWTQIDADPLFDETGAHTGFMAIETDITERKEHEATIRKNRKHLEMALDAADMGIWEWDVEGDVLTFSEHGQRLFGEGFARVTSEQFLDRLHPADRTALIRSVQKALARRGILNATYRIIRPDGGMRWINSRGRVHTSEAGNPVRMIGTVADVTKRAQTEARNQAMLRAIPDLIFRFGADGTYLDVDAEHEAQLAAPAEDLVGKTVDDVLPPDLAATWKQHIRAAIDTSELQHLEYSLTTQDGIERAFEGRIVPIGNQEVQAIIRDITERKKRQQELIEAKQHAEEMNRLKSSFLANMSHELRTPLTSILGFSEILAEEIDDNGNSELAHLIARSGKRLMETLNSVLDLAQLESQSVALDLGRIDLVREAREAVGILSPHKKSEGVTLRVDVPEAPVWAMGEPGALSRVLNNLMSNALKFTTEGHVALIVRETETHAVLQVEDTGIGIDASFLPHVFEEFRQESTGAGREYEGAGLGLTITKRLVEQMGGAIQVTSEKDEGTTFTVRLPKPEDD